MAESSVAAGQQILPLIDHLARISRRAADAAMADGSLRPRHVIALTLLDERGPMTQHAVGAALSLDPSNVVGLLNELEERGLITRRRDPADRRRHIVEVSATGADELTQTYAQLGLVEDELFKTLTCEQRSTLHELLASAVAGLSPSHASARVRLPGTGVRLRRARARADRARPRLPDARSRLPGAGPARPRLASAGAAGARLAGRNSCCICPARVGMMTSSHPRQTESRLEL